METDTNLARAWEELEKMKTDAVLFAMTQFGFKFGNAEFTRICSDSKKKWIVVELKTSKYNRKGTKKSPIQIYVTKTGKVRIFSGGKEWRICDEE